MPFSTRQEARESRPHPEETRVRLLAREEGSFPALSGMNSWHSCGISRGGAPHRKGERKSRVVPPFQSPPDVSVPGMPRLSSRGSTHTTVARGTALWESLVGKPYGKASRESQRSLDTRKGKRDTAATAREESARACPHSRRGPTPLGRLQKYPKILVSTGEECSGSGTDSTQDLRPRHRRECNPERPPSNSHGDWPFLRPT